MFEGRFLFPRVLGCARLLGAWLMTFGLLSGVSGKWGAGDDSGRWKVRVGILQRPRKLGPRGRVPAPLFLDCGVRLRGRVTGKKGREGGVREEKGRRLTISSPAISGLSQGLGIPRHDFWVSGEWGARRGIIRRNARGDSRSAKTDVGRLLPDEG